VDTFAKAAGTAPQGARTLRENNRTGAGGGVERKDEPGAHEETKSAVSGNEAAPGARRQIATFCYKIVFRFSAANSFPNLSSAVPIFPTMHRPQSHSLTDTQVTLLVQRRRDLGFSPQTLRGRFEEALRRDGCVFVSASARMRLDRVLNPSMRLPASEGTLLALASALEWTLAELETALGLEPVGVSL
jgi:hypothetical protein